MLTNTFGLTFMNNTAVKNCELKNGICEVQTANNQTLFAEKVAICNGHEFKLLFPEIFNQSGMKICKLNMMQTYPLPEIKLNSNILSGLSVRRYDSFKSCTSYPYLQTPEWQKPYKQWGIHILFKQALNGSIIIGDSHEYAEVHENGKLPIGIDMEINELILKEAKRMMHLPNWKIQNYWAGYYAQTADGGIFEHQIADKIFIATGIGGKGMTTAAGYSKHRIETIFA
jgi:FAD dependent oxidoreductase TIGR03364